MWIEKYKKLYKYRDRWLDKQYKLYEGSTNMIHNRSNKEKIYDRANRIDESSSEIEHFDISNIFLRFWYEII